MDSGECWRHSAGDTLCRTVPDSAGQCRTVPDSAGQCRTSDRTGPDLGPDIRTRDPVQNPPDTTGHSSDIPDSYRTVIPDSTGQCTGQRTGQQSDNPGHSPDTPDNRAPRAQPFCTTLVFFARIFPGLFFFLPATVTRPLHSRYTSNPLKH